MRVYFCRCLKESHIPCSRFTTSILIPDRARRRDAAQGRVDDDAVRAVRRRQLDADVASERQHVDVVVGHRQVAERRSRTRNLQHGLRRPFGKFSFSATLSSHFKKNGCCLLLPKVLDISERLLYLTRCPVLLGPCWMGSDSTSFPFLLRNLNGTSYFKDYTVGEFSHSI